MITKAELLEIAKLKGINNIGYAEKDYLLELVLFLLSKNTKQELVFKGGTALYKLYKLERFSEDLDFSETKTVDIDNLMRKVISDLSRFKIEANISKIREPFNSILLTFRIKGPLYDGRPQTLCSIRIDINRKSTVELEPSRLRVTSLYTEIPSFYVIVMQEKEILAEKIRAIMTRNKARDLLDAYALIEKNIEIDKKLIEKKLNYYNLTFNKKKFIDGINKKQKLWARELMPLVINLPPFKEVKNTIRGILP